MGLAETLLALGRKAESDEVVERARKAFGDVPPLVILTARRDLRKRDPGAAQARLAALLDGDDDFARAAWSFTAVAKLAEGDPEGALTAADRALSLDANEPVATFVVGMALQRKNDARAVAWLERARLLAPNDSVITDESRKCKVRPPPRRRPPRVVSCARHGDGTGVARRWELVLRTRAREKAQFRALSSRTKSAPRGRGRGRCALGRHSHRVRVRRGDRRPLAHTWRP